MRASRCVWLAVLSAAFLAGPAAAAAAPTGYDVAYPLCGQTLPTGAAFAVVGVNGGLANNVNPCLAVELGWAAVLPGQAGPSEPRASLYVNTADPGPRVADWPTQTSEATPFGACDGTWSPACGYLYGALRAGFSYQQVVAANGGVDPSLVPWWLDIETVSSWAKPTDIPVWAAVNVATVQGFVAGLRLSGARGTIGFYSTGTQWLAITGLDATSTKFPRSSPDWIAGVGSLGAAKARCQESFSGAPVELAQYAAGGLDGDYVCPPAASARLRIASHTLRGATLRVVGTIEPTYRGRVTVELSARYRGGVIHRSRSAVAVGGRWAVSLALSTQARLSGGSIVARSRAAVGLPAAAAGPLRVRLS
ncbi:MAG: hypothetical protein ACR2KV_07605 [Solirubrobacteraceae bacterium]